MRSGIRGAELQSCHKMVFGGKIQERASKIFLQCFPNLLQIKRIGSAKLHQKDFRNKTENRVIIEFLLCFVQSMGT